MGSSTKTKTTIPDPTPEELGILNLARDGLMMSYLDQSGYEVSKSVTTWDNSEEAKTFSDRLDILNNRITVLQNQTQDPSLGRNQKAIAQQQLTQAQNDLYKVQNEQSEAQKNFKPDIEYSTRRKDDLTTENIRAQYGADSEEYKVAKQSYDANQEALQQQQQNTQVLMMNAAEKFLKGDYSTTTSQKEYVDSILGPVKDAGLKAIDYIKEQAGVSKSNLEAAADQVGSEYKNTAESLNKALDVFREEVRKTGMSMGDAVQELEQRVTQTGGNMKQALEESLNYSKALAEMGIEDFSLKTRNSIAQQAAALGRSPTDPQFIQQMQSDVGREIARSNLQFGEAAASGRMGIEQLTGQGLENAAMMRANIAERTGQGMEQAAQQGLGIAERTGAGMESVANSKFGIAQGYENAMMQAAQMRGQVEAGSAESKANMLTQLGMNQPIQSISTGMNIGQYNQGIEQTRLANAQAAMQAPMPFLSYYNQRNMAQPTTTQTTSMGAGQIVGGLIGTGLSAAGMAGSLGWKPFG